MYLSEDYVSGQLHRAAEQRNLEQEIQSDRHAENFRQIAGGNRNLAQEP